MQFIGIRNLGKSSDRTMFLNRWQVSILCLILLVIFFHLPLIADIPVNTKLSATIKVKGDIATFAEKYGQTKLSIRKGSDI